MQHPSKVNEYHFTASEFDWEIAPGKTIRAWGFNGQLPGPVINAKKGETVAIKVKNQLPEPTIIHWHGIRLDAAMDGTDAVQNPIQPGEEFEYRFVVPDAGTFWYHSHFNETVQVERGMYGALVVKDENDPVLDDEKVIMIDDMKLRPDYQFKQPFWFLPRFIERHDGRQGDTLLINGKKDSELEMNAGQIERWRIINSSSARYFRLYFEGRPFKIIGTDGGLIQTPVIATEALLTPGERLDIVIGPFQEGEVFQLKSLAYNRTTFVKAKPQAFAIVKVKEQKPSIAYIPDQLRAIETLAAPNATTSRKIKFSVGPSLRKGLNFLVNNRMHLNDSSVKMGELQVWEVSNTSLMDHPFHLHGYFFQVLEENGKQPEYLSWKDTYNLRPRSKVKIAWMPDRQGTWMYHCHILEHHAAGMMAHFNVTGDSRAETSMPSTHKHHH
jgi:FtsP/CotA-like multicopper oxidase with cupredoxin domain